MSGEPMTDERLREIESRIDTLSGFSISEPVRAGEMYTMGMDLLAEVYRLRAKQADDDALSLQFGSRYFADGEEISHLRHRLEHEHDAWNHEADLLQKEDRRLRAENMFLRARCDTLESVRDVWNRAATEYKDEMERLQSENAAMRTALAGSGEQDLKLVDAFIDMEIQARGLRAENAAMRPIVAMLSACEAVQHPTFTLGGIDGVLLYHTTVNVLWMREKARAFLASEAAGQAVAASDEGE